MIPRSAEADLARLRGEGASRAEIARALNWENSGWPDFDYYAPIMEAAAGAVILGAEAPRAQLRTAMAEGAAAAFGEGAARFGLDLALPSEEQAAQETIQAEAHCDMLPPEMLPGMVAAQRLRDALLAEAVLRAVALPGDGPVLVIAGNGHAGYDSGAPALLRLAAPELSLFVLAQLEAPPQGDLPYDAVHVTGAPERDDPCAAFAGR
ncbi:hypothetical protein HMH01_00395 [Halovulum dunhuangense]|uniref:Haem-binding uptake Tiki superfamily ChaN domain-containing protein n=1 Tax=Halovulum dunhuangense TaxID=1505036 RepID=A0A849KPB3_9RHOB|nr:ChaN family lipoprotein [Halovulum dunhuangense]NNU78883.1 hypothetical protein [Halovulum dunhuangense]